MVGAICWSHMLTYTQVLLHDLSLYELCQRFFAVCLLTGHRLICKVLHDFSKGVNIL
jgi:hypothetical protein